MLPKQGKSAVSDAKVVENESHPPYFLTMMAATTSRDCAGVPRGRSRAAVAENLAWKQVGQGWQPLHGSFRRLGYSVEWHDFTLERDLDWSRSFHPGSVEICLNLAGCGEVRAGRKTVSFTPASAGFYAQQNAALDGWRRGGERHQFITIEFSLAYLKRQIPAEASTASRLLAGLFNQTAPVAAAVSDPVRLTHEQRQLALSLRHPPVPVAGHAMWYQGKALEIAAAMLYGSTPEEELFCQRRQRLSRERVQKVIAILRENPAEPPPLEEIGRRVGCSHFYLSRIFTEEMGKTISACLRDLRMERAAGLLRQGRLNVTQVAMEVGYSSLSHFSAAFHEAFGCCPGLYPLATSAQAAVKNPSHAS
jgi:AraC-like DNA-binding protein